MKRTTGIEIAILVVPNPKYGSLGDIDVNKPQYGRTIGTHMGKPIYESFEEQDRKYVFDRLAKCDDEGCPLDQVKEGELLVNPGLIYKKAS